MLWKDWPPQCRAVMIHFATATLQVIAEEERRKQVSELIGDENVLSDVDGIAKLFIDAADDLGGTKNQIHDGTDVARKFTNSEAIDLALYYSGLTRGPDRADRVNS